MKNGVKICKTRLKTACVRYILFCFFVHTCFHKNTFWLTLKDYSNLVECSLIELVLKNNYVAYQQTIDSTNYNVYQKKIMHKIKRFCGGAGYRSRYLSHAKRALYHLSYAPVVRKRVLFYVLIQTFKVQNKEVTA